MTPSISVNGVSYSYGPGTDALFDVTLDVPAGAVLGVLGANGAGKTTLLQCMAGLRAPTRGRVLVDAHDVRHRARIVAGDIGYVGAGVTLPGELTLARLMHWLAPLHARWDATLADELCDRFALGRTRKLATLSRGESMKAALLCALAARTPLLILDEPFTGLDIASKDDIVRGLLASGCTNGTTLVIASHDITELEPVMTHAAVLHGGRLFVTGSVEALQARFQRVTLVADQRQLDTFANEQAWLTVTRAGRVVTIIADGTLTPVDAPMLARRYGAADVLDVDALPLRDLVLCVARGGRGEPVTREAA
jgi:ABC-2 type transport system ATP-binding protein